MGALFDAISGAVGKPQRVPSPEDWSTPGGSATDGRTRKFMGSNPPEAGKYGTEADMRATLHDEPTRVAAEPARGGLFDTIASAVGAPAAKEAPAPAAPAMAHEPATLQLGKTIVNQASGVGSAIMGGWRGLAAIASGAGLDEAARQVHEPELAGGATARAYETDAPMAQAAALPGEAMGWVANRAGEAVTDATGSPAAGAAVNTGIQAIPLAFIKRGGGVARAEPKVVGSSSIAEAPAIAAPGPNLDIPTVIRQRQAQAVPVAAAANDVAAPRQPLTLAPTEPTRGRVEPPTPAEPVVEPPKFTESAPAGEPGKGVPLPEQERRAAVLRAVGIDEARESAVKGDPKAAATDFQQSRLTNPAGDFMRATLDNERQALTSHAEQIVRDTGGTLGTDAQALEARGHTILAPLEGFRQWFTDQTKGLYADARAKAQGQPVELGKFRDILGTDSKFANTDTIELRKGVQARMKELGMIDKEGNVLPATVDQAENLRQYVNEEWSPKSNVRIRELKNALDEDVTSAAGEDTFKKARALHAMKMSIFDDPKGLSSILDSEGINRKVPVEKIADTIAALPNAQFAHIVKTLKTVPAELQAQAQAALAEIKAQMANKVLDAGSGRVGQWGARDVAAVLNKNAAKLPLVFEPAELVKLKNLNEAGHILAKDQSYPGAAVQEHNLVRRGAMGAIRSSLAGAGAWVGGPVGAAAGDMVGSALTGKMSEAAALKAAQKRVVKLSEFLK